ncbi:MAG TPA: hypothetical protein VFI98_14610 [Pseudolabrys sp.]|nr:hypothetical protein [Pseudolabrys sp.]
MIADRVPAFLSSRPAAHVFFILLLAAALSPTLLVSIPAMADYPNHLARMFLLSRADGPNPSPFYQIVWALYPNLAMDLVVPFMARFMDVVTATKIFFLLSQLLVVTGAMALERAVKNRIAISGCVALMFLYSLPFAWGFVNFESGLGVALWALAGAIALNEYNWLIRITFHAVSTLVLFAAHFFALGIYGFAIGVHELWRAWSKQRPLNETVSRLLLLGLPALAVMAAMVSTGGVIGGTGTYWFLQYKPLWPIRIMSGYSVVLSAICVVGLIAGIYELAKHRLLRFSSSGAWLAAGFAGLYIAMPSKLFDTSFVDLRIIVAAALIMPAFVTVKLPDMRWRLAAAAGTAAITLANVGIVLSVWLSYRADYAAVIGSFDRIAKKSLVLIAHSGAADDPPLGELTEYPMYHAPVLAVHFADAFVPDLFNAPGKQPVMANPAYRELDIPYGGPVPLAILKAIAEKQKLTNVPRYIRDWPDEYDYLYLLGPRIPNPLPQILEELQGQRRFALYRIRK